MPEILLDKRCFKIDRTNAKAMLEGFFKNGKKVRQSIYCDVRAKPFPMLLTLHRTKTRFMRSDLGDSLKPDDFSIPFKFIVDLDSEYFIKNEIRLWEILCHNSLFDVWDPRAPFSRFGEAKTDPSKYRILLLRLYETYEEYHQSDVIHVNNIDDELIAANKKVTIKKPIIPNEEFQKIKKLLKKSVAKYLL